MTEITADALGEKVPDLELAECLRRWGHRRLGMNYPSEEAELRPLLRRAADAIDAMHANLDAVARAALPFCGLDSCNRIKNGLCSTRKCMIRGGHVPGSKPDYHAATCEAYELALAVGALSDPHRKQGAPK